MIVAAALAVLATGLVARRLRAVAPALGATAVAAGLALPWQLYVARHDLRTGLYEASALADPGELAGRADRLAPSLSALLETLAKPLEWALAVPLFALLAAVAFFSGSRRIAVFGGVWAGVLIGQLLLAYWIANTPLDWHLATSEKRVVAPLAVGMIALAPLLVGGRADDASPARPPQSASGLPG